MLNEMVGQNEAVWMGGTVQLVGASTRDALATVRALAARTVAIESLIADTLASLEVEACRDEIRSANCEAAWCGNESAARALLFYW